MKLHEFIATYRMKILDACAQRLGSSGSGSEEALEMLDARLEEIMRALKDNAAPAPRADADKSGEVAANYGRRRQRVGSEIGVIIRDYAALWDAVSAVAVDEGATFSVREFQVLHGSIDAGIATAIQEFAAQAAHEHEHRAYEQLGALAHEFRNALSSATMAFAALRSERADIQSKTGTVLDRSLSRMRDLVQQTIASVQHGAGAPLEARRLRVADLLRDVESVTLAARGIVVVIEAGEDLEVEADPRLLMSAVGNLLHNALKFTPDGGRVALRARREAGRVLIDVEDECGGLPAGKEDELFEPFVQRGADRSGLGLGLSIARDAVRAHHGEIRVGNRPGAGCVFTVVLPAAPARRV
ncbi:MAG: HAMP domain-containing histidine kinase [Polyangiaceae bacterium]|nr:HAMP domain-containing histidine kinase [Polyangiaceae bacterium]